MNRKSKLTPISLAVGAAFATSLAMAPMAQAASNPFAMNQLEAGYKLADAGKEGACGANAKPVKEASCGANKQAAEQKVKKEGKCGEAKCGANK